MIRIIRVVNLTPEFMDTEIFITKGFEETQKVGKRIGKSLARGRLARLEGRTFQNLQKAIVIALYGELGSGKTTFVQGVAKGLGIKRRLISPTFVLVRKYRIKNKELRIKNFYHIDLYRLENEKQIEELGVEEIIHDSQNVVVTEWAEKMRTLLPQERIDIKFENLGKDKRRITITNNF